MPHFSSVTPGPWHPENPHMGEKPVPHPVLGGRNPHRRLFSHPPELAINTNTNYYLK
ncbi:MAG: hypothetical protein LWX83_03880 [Anaerolineae bacterium]|nr:hypothetical protein [Anaerolineae bacterium]